MREKKKSIQTSSEMTETMQSADRDSKAIYYNYIPCVQRRQTKATAKVKTWKTEKDKIKPMKIFNCLKQKHARQDSGLTAVQILQKKKIGVLEDTALDTI